MQRPKTDVNASVPAPDATVDAAVDKPVAEADTLETLQALLR